MKHYRCKGLDSNGHRCYQEYEIVIAEERVFIFDTSSEVPQLIDWYFGEYDEEGVDKAIDYAEKENTEKFEKVDIGNVWLEFEKTKSEFFSDDEFQMDKATRTPILIGIGNKIAKLPWCASVVSGLDDYLDWLIDDEEIDLLVTKTDCYYTGGGIWIVEIPVVYKNQQCVFDVDNDNIEEWALYKNIPKNNGHYETVYYPELMVKTGNADDLDVFKKQYMKALKLLATRKE